MPDSTASLGISCEVRLRGVVSYVTHGLFRKLFEILETGKKDLKKKFQKETQRSQKLLKNTKTSVVQDGPGSPAPPTPTPSPLSGPPNLRREHEKELALKAPWRLSEQTFQGRGRRNKVVEKKVQIFRATH